MDELHEAYDVDVAKLNRLAARSAERAEKLKAENEKLKKRLAQYGMFREVVGDPAVEFANLRRELHRVERENEKLRELVRDVWDVALHPHLFGDGSYLLRRMRDLGIEVDG